jgi:glycosyltransferase involved in cell wall biosynthesis
MTTSIHSLPISVILTAYNAEQYLTEAVDSVLAQTHSDFELLLVNDGSTDRSGEIIDAYAARDTRVRPIHHANWGISASLNHAIEQARHEWLARMDADDIMLPSRLERQKAFIAENPDVDVVATLVHMIDAEGNVRWSTTSKLVDRETFQHYVDTNKILHIYHPTVMMRKSIVQAVGGYRPEFPPAEDMDLWNRIAEAGGLILVQPEHLLKYRVHPGSVSIANARVQMETRNWVLRCTECRRSGVPEPSFEEFLESEGNQSPLRRLRNTHHIWTEMHFKRSTTLYLNGKRGPAMFPLAAAMILNPLYCARRVRSMLAKSSRVRDNSRVSELHEGPSL